jgi:hypothetical protein
MSFVPLADLVHFRNEGHDHSVQHGGICVSSGCQFFEGTCRLAQAGPTEYRRTSSKSMRKFADFSNRWHPAWQSIENSRERRPFYCDAIGKSPRDVLECGIGRNRIVSTIACHLQCPS